MKISQLIEQLEFLKERSGDCEISLDVKDFYSRYGSQAKFGYDPERHNESMWEGTYTNNSHLTLDIHLLSQEDKQPKITFRKPR